MHDSDSFLKNKMLNILWDFNKQMDYLISARRSDQVIYHSGTKDTLNPPLWPRHGNKLTKPF